MNRQIRPLSRAVDREESKADGWNGVEPRVAVTQLLACQLRDAVRRDRVWVRLIFGEGNLTCGAVDGTGGGKQKPLNRKLARQFQQVQRSLDVHPLVEQWLFERGPDAGAGGEMNDSLGSMLLEEFGETMQITNIGLDKLIVSARLDLS